MANLNKTQQVEGYLRQAIRGGRWSPGQRMPGEHDLLNEFGVSRVTVREALASLAKDGLVIRKSGSGTYVSDLTRSGTIVIYAEASGISASRGFWFRSLLDRAMERIESVGYVAKLSTAYGRNDEELISSTHLFDPGVSRDVLGVLCLGRSGCVVNKLSEAGIPCVVVDNWLDSEYCVLLDSERLTEIAVELLRGRGYSEYAFMYVNSPLSRKYEELERKHKGYARFGGAVLGVPDDRLIPVPDSLELGDANAIFKRWWARTDRPKALFFNDDGLFEVVSHAMLELNIRVPEDIAIVTHANVRRHFNFPVPLYRIGFEASEAIDAALDMLNRVIDSGTLSEKVVRLEPHVRMGRSL